MVAEGGARRQVAVHRIMCPKVDWGDRQTPTDGAGAMVEEVQGDVERDLREDVVAGRVNAVDALRRLLCAEEEPGWAKTVYSVPSTTPGRAQCLLLVRDEGPATAEWIQSGKEGMAECLACAERWVAVGREHGDVLLIKDDHTWSVESLSTLAESEEEWERLVRWCT
jgi:hypothetical protein